MIWFVIPAYNEERNISDMILETEAYMRRMGWPARLLVVDDGSTDGTAAIVKELERTHDCELLSYRPNRGVAQAFRTGLNEALSRSMPDDLIVTIEADRTGDLNILPEMLSRAGRGADVVLASIYAMGGGIEGTTPFRVFTSKCANWLIRKALGLHMTRTYSSFFRAHRPSALKAVLARYGDYFIEDGFACVIELLVRCHRTGQKIEEVPMLLRGQMRRGPSKMKVVRTTLGYFRVIGRNAFSA